MSYGDLETVKLGVLISGRGSNLQSLLEAKAKGRLPNAEFAVVVSNVPDARGLDVARKHGVVADAIDSRLWKGRREEHEEQVHLLLQSHGCEAVVLAGYMRVLSPGFIRRWRNRMINIHPALLPSFPGLHGQRQALEYGVRVSGCTVHFVDEGTDTGPIILQHVVDVMPDDSEDSLSARILEREHAALVEAVDLLSSSRLSVEGRRVIIHSSTD